LAELLEPFDVFGSSVMKGVQNSHVLSNRAAGSEVSRPFSLEAAILKEFEFIETQIRYV